MRGLQHCIGEERGTLNWMVDPATYWEVQLMTQRTECLKETSCNVLTTQGMGIGRGVWIGRW